MAEYTTNLKLTKPSQDDFVNIADINGNMDIIDSKISQQDTTIQNIKETQKNKADLRNGKVPSEQLPDMNYIPTSCVVQTSGNSIEDIMSQNAVTTAIDDAKTAIDKTISTAKDELSKEITKNKINVVQETGESTTDVMSQKAVTEALKSGGGTSINVVQTTGESTEDVMSQNAVTVAIEASHGANNTITESEYAHADGEGNSIDTSDYATANGHENTIEKSAGGVAIGENNTVSGNSIGGIGIGVGNSVQTSSYSCAVGTENSLGGGTANFAGGEKNSVNASTDCSVFGKSNIVANTDSSLISGLSNNVTSVQWSGIIGEGNQVHASSSSRLAISVYGNSNTVTSTSGDTTVIGFSNTIQGNMLRDYIIGDQNKGNNYLENCYLFGNFNAVQNQSRTNIFGSHNTIATNATSTHEENTVLGNDNNITVMSGRSVNESGVLGNSNTLNPTNLSTSNSLYTVGTSNTISGTTSFVAGHNNNSSGTNMSLVGFMNRIQGENNSNVYALGCNNTGSQDTTVGIIGDNNKPNGSAGCYLIGTGNTTTGCYNTSVFGYNLMRTDATIEENPSTVGTVIVGAYNEDTDAYFAVGNGTSNTDRHNAFWVTSDKVVINNDVTINGVLEGYATKEDIGQIAGNSTFVSVSYVDGAISVSEDSGIGVSTKTYTDEEAFILYDGTNRNKGYSAHFTWTNAEHTKNAEIIGFVRPTGTVVVFNGVISELGSDIVLYADDGEEIGTISINEDRILSLDFTGDRSSLKMEGYITTFRQG